MSRIRVGVLGYGFAAKNFHLPFLLAIPDYEVVAILQRAEAPADPVLATRGAHCTIDFPNIKHYRKAEEFFADPDIDFVVVATHADTHASFAEHALEAGKHGNNFFFEKKKLAYDFVTSCVPLTLQFPVIIDKPFARSTEEADKIIKLATEKRLTLTCFQNRRYVRNAWHSVY